jgi:hypothetical protein
MIQLLLSFNGLKNNTASINLWNSISERKSPGRVSLLTCTHNVAVVNKIKPSIIFVRICFTD